MQQLIFHLLTGPTFTPTNPTATNDPANDGDDESDDDDPDESHDDSNDDDDVDDLVVKMWLLFIWLVGNFNLNVRGLPLKHKVATKRHGALLITFPSP